MLGCQDCMCGSFDHSWTSDRSQKQTIIYYCHSNHDELLTIMQYQKLHCLAMYVYVWYGICTKFTVTLTSLLAYYVHMCVHNYVSESYVCMYLLNTDI